MSLDLGYQYKNKTRLTPNPINPSPSSPSCGAQPNWQIETSRWLEQLSTTLVHPDYWSLPLIVCWPPAFTPATVVLALPLVPKWWPQAWVLYTDLQLRHQSVTSTSRPWPDWPTWIWITIGEDRPRWELRIQHHISTSLLLLPNFHSLTYVLADFNSLTRFLWF
jgi:hypothetical protein